MRIRTVKIATPSSEVFSLVAQVGLHQRTLYALAPDEEFTAFLTEQVDKTYSYISNQDHVLHDNTAASFLAWAAEVAKRPLRLYAVERRFKSVWPSSPNIAADWTQYSVGLAGGGKLGVLFRSAEPRDDDWARRIQQLPGGQSQRITELYAVLSKDQGQIVPFPFVIPEAGNVQPLTEMSVGQVSEPTWAAAVAVLGAPCLTYACQTRWTEVVMPTPAPGFVTGVTTTTNWEDSVPPFNGIASVAVSELELYNDSDTEELAYRFGPGTYSAGTLAPKTSAYVPIPALRSFRFNRASRLQLRSASPAVSYRVRFLLA